MCVAGLSKFSPFSPTWESQLWRNSTTVYKSLNSKLISFSRSSRLVHRYEHFKHLLYAQDKLAQRRKSVSCFAFNSLSSLKSIFRVRVRVWNFELFLRKASALFATNSQCDNSHRNLQLSSVDSFFSCPWLPGPWTTGHKHVCPCGFLSPSQTNRLLTYCHMLVWAGLTCLCT